MRKIDSQQFLCLDCETTGLEISKDRIIEVAAVCFDMENVYQKFDSLIDPGCIIPSASIKIHHITQEMVKGKPHIKEVLPDFLKFVGDHIIVGHGIQFDIAILACAAERENIPTTIKKNTAVDTLRMARLYGESPENSLESLRKHFHIEPEVAHRAMSDVIVNIEVFKRLVKRYRSVEELLDVLSRPVLLKEMPLGKHKGRPMSQVPLQYLKWAVTKNFDQDLMYSLRTEIKRRKKGNLFSQAVNPFKDL